MVTLTFAPARTWPRRCSAFWGDFSAGIDAQLEAGLPEIVPTRSPVAFSSERAPGRQPSSLCTGRQTSFDRDQATFLGYVMYSREGTWIESMYGDADHRYLEMQVFWRQRLAHGRWGNARFKPVNVAVMMDCGAKTCLPPSSPGRVAALSSRIGVARYRR